MAAVVKMIAEKSGWGTKKLIPGAPAWASASSTATAATSLKSPKSRVDSSKRIKINKVWVGGDIGSQIISPMHAENLVQGGVIEGISHMMQEITVKGGQVVQNNFHQVPLLRMAQSPPVIETHWLSSNSADRSRRAVAAADPSGDCQRDLRGERHSRAVAAALEARLPLGIALRVDAQRPLPTPARLSSSWELFCTAESKKPKSGVSGFGEALTFLPLTR